MNGWMGKRPPTEAASHFCTSYTYAAFFAFHVSMMEPDCSFI